MYSSTVSVRESIYINRYVRECVLFTSVCGVRGWTWAFPVSGNEIWIFFIQLEVGKSWYLCVIFPHLPVLAVSSLLDYSLSS